MTPFEIAELPAAYRSPASYMASFNVDYDTACQMVRTAQRGTLFLNDTYQVNRSPVFMDENMGQPMIHLSIKRIDKEPIRDWRDMQVIKNMLTSPEHVGVEVYPAESQLVDMANQYHLWVYANPNFRLPFGWKERMVCDEVHSAKLGAKQRPGLTLESKEVMNAIQGENRG